jgi:acetoin utilization deacetylase AcuC-like enzyme
MAGKIATVWDAAYCVEAARTNSTTKQAGVVAAAVAEGLLDVRSVPFDPDGTWADIARMHDPQYVEAVRTGEPRRLAESQGFAWSPEFADSPLRIWGGHQAACRLALTEKLVLHPVSGAHHAHYGCGLGYCTFHHLVGAGRALLREAAVQRVAIIDLDAHQGDGTLALAGDDPAFALFDISGWKWVGELDDGRRFYRVAKDGREYGRHLRRLASWLDRVKPDLVQYQAGADPFENDDVGAIPGMTANALRERDDLVIHALLARKIPTVVNFAGGYVPGVTEGLHLQTIQVMADALGIG